MMNFILENTDLLIQTICITPLVGASLISGGLNALGSIFTNKKNNDTAKETNQMMMRFQADQQEKNNKFNAQEAQKQRDFERSMSNTAIQRQMNDLRASGFNPAMIGASPSGASTPSGATASASSASSPNLMAARFENPFGFVDPLTASQIEVNKAQAHNLESGAQKQEKETSWIDQMNGSQLAINESTIRVNGSTVELNDEKKKQLDQLIKESESVVKVNEERINEIKQNVASMSVHSQVEVLTYLLNTREVEAKIKELASRASLNYENARDLVATRSARILGLQMSAYSSLKQGELYDAEAGKIRIDNLNGQLEFDIRNANKDWETFRYRAESIIQPLGDAVGTITQLWDIKRAFTGQHETSRHNRATETEIKRHNQAMEHNETLKRGNESIRNDNDYMFKSNRDRREQEKHDAYKYGQWYDSDNWRNRSNPMTKRFR